MKETLTITIFLLASSFTAFGQQKYWGTKSISQWSFEKFPLHYTVVPAKAMTSKNAFTGNLESYREQNELGQPDGLTLTMRADGIYASGAIYTYEGNVVYNVSFFPASKKAQAITNYNTEGVLDGYKIYRTLNRSGGYDEDIEKYDNGKLVELNGVKQTAASSTYVDSLLDGAFNKRNASYVIDGDADMGEIKRMKQAYQGKYSIREITLMDDSFRVQIPSNYNEDDFSFSTYPLVSNPKVTESKATCLKYGNYNGYPYLLAGTFIIQDLEEILKNHYPEPLETKVSFSDSLLDGNFQYREYLNSSPQFSGKYIDVYGTAKNGKLLNISRTIIEMNPYDGNVKSNKKIEYIFSDDTIIQNDYVLQVSSEPVQTKVINLEYPVLLTNSNHQGGVLYFGNTTYSTLGIPYKRDAKLEDNKYGFYFFNPNTFGFDAFLRTVTTVTQRPVDRNINENNGLLDGDFEFRQDRIHFIGIAKNGIIENLVVKYDFETNDWVGEKRCAFNQKKITLNGDKYNAQYTMSENTNSHCQQDISFTKNRKLTNSIDMEEYDGFIYYSNDTALRNILMDLRFIDQQ